MLAKEVWFFDVSLIQYDNHQSLAFLDPEEISQIQNEIIYC